MRRREQSSLNFRRRLDLVFEPLSILPVRLDKSQQSADARHQLSRRERLRYVIVRSKVQSGYAIGLLHPGRQKNDGCFEARLSKLSTNIEAVLSGKHHIEKNKVELVFEGPAARACPGRYHLDLITFKP